jgi:hypothetical protein
VNNVTDLTRARKYALQVELGTHTLSKNHLRDSLKASNNTTTLNFNTIDAQQITHLKEIMRDTSIKII